MCDVLDLCRSGYYAWKKREKSLRQREYDVLLPIVREVHRISNGTYGARRIADEIVANGIPCGRTKAATIMKRAGVAARQKRKFKITTDSKHSLPVAPNLLNREFMVDKPDTVYVSDITYIWTSEGWIYLAVVLDLFSRQVVGWSMNNQMERTLVIDALLMAIWRRKPARGLIHHSDRGSQYCSGDFQNILQTHGIICSMSRKGNCWDNAVAESFFGSLKTERVFFAKYKTKDDARKDITDYIEMFYNSKRRHSYLGNVSPREYEDKYHQKKVA